ncbi:MULTISPECIES: 3-deoxy-7-phosphoheptulonate synthase [Fusobacterium]|jgi:3-deoxy-7-phosphoheptulonate synthase|uniref:3-deoxy-7-phosphoheptulonate synthase n=1 Tax=Fusobacterium hominis TaxID=2764326 RepID=A0A7G9GUU2_9FUSO|nr:MULTISPECIES: 3-deoxy-7-phosphoheptulonate synthase [Fusobacterium]QNM14574.1 3-deoxy-7-phosphoheptulonate synthase [Fusobacterium hominis]
MYIKTKRNIGEEEKNEILKFISANRLGNIIKEEKDYYRIGIIGNTSNVDLDILLSFAGVDEIVPIGKSYKFVSREFQPQDSVIDIKGRKIGGGNFLMMAGPCAIENRESIFKIAKAVKDSGAQVLRGGAFKPRTSPYDFQGLGEDGLKYMREAADKYDLLVVTEVMDSNDIPLIEKYADIFQVGARNMQNFSLLKALGKSNKPVLLKRGLSATIREFLMAAEYIVAYGNENVILCERGIRTFETMTRNTVDINAIPLIKEKSHLPIIIDASHGTGRRTLVQPVTMAGIIAGADGAMVEVHENPECACSDGMQSLHFDEFDRLMKNIDKLLVFRKEIV